MLRDLEYVVLGVVWRDQPCTAYAVRMVFRSSLSAHWSGSAGAIYPLIRRLEGRRLLTSTQRSGDGRGTRLYRISPQGRRRLADWLKPPLPDAAELMPLDPLRVRFAFIETLPPQQQKAAAADAQRRIRNQLTSIRQHARQARAESDRRYWLHRGAELGAQAQLRWLDEFAAAL